MEWISPKTNWNAESYFNFEDMNRIENNTGVVRDLIIFLEGNFDFDIKPIKTDRDMTSIEFADSLNRIEMNIGAIKDEFYPPIGWEVCKTDWKAGDKFDYIDANRLEKNLKLLYDLVKSTADNIKYCGTFSCGEEVI